MSGQALQRLIERRRHRAMRSLTVFAPKPSWLVVDKHNVPGASVVRIAVGLVSKQTTSLIASVRFSCVDEVDNMQEKSK